MDIPVLIVENDPDHQELARMHLSRDGIEDVQIVDSLEAAVDACRERHPDVVVVDSGVVGEDRLPLIGQLRQRAPGARIIGYSAGARTESWADAHFLKGGSFDQLIAEIRKGAFGSRS